jgi:hypothetical protein
VAEPHFGEGRDSQKPTDSFSTGVSDVQAQLRCSSDHASGGINQIQSKPTTIEEAFVNHKNMKLKFILIIGSALVIHQAAPIARGQDSDAAATIKQLQKRIEELERIVQTIQQNSPPRWPPLRMLASNPSTKRCAY